MQFRFGISYIISSKCNHRLRLTENIKPICCVISSSSVSHRIWNLNFAISLTTISPLEFKDLSISSSMIVSAFLQSKLIEIEPKLNSVSKGTVLSNSSIMHTFWLLDVCACHHQRSQSEMESSHVLLLPPHLPHPHLLPSLLDVSSYIEPDEFSTI